MKIIFYISSHGFGHMARNVPVIAALLADSRVERVYVRCAGAHLTFLKDNVFSGAEKLTCLEEETDVGHDPYPGTMIFDRETTEGKVRRYMAGWPERIGREADFLKKEGIDRGVADIVPWALAACAQAGVRSLFISNFTWNDIYREYFEEDILEPYRRCYELADRALLYRLAMPGLEQYFRSYRRISYVCRPFSRERAAQIRAGHIRPILYISVGKAVSLTGEIRADGLPWDFIVTEGVPVTGENVTVLDRGIPDTHNVILACDYMISKAGWGSIAEAMLARKKLALISRPTVAEDCNSIRQLKEQGLCMEISEEELHDLGRTMEALVWMKPGDFSGCTNDVGVICEEILAERGDGGRKNPALGLPEKF